MVGITVRPIAQPIMAVIPCIRLVLMAVIQVVVRLIANATMTGPITTTEIIAADTQMARTITGSNAIKELGLPLIAIQPVNSAIQELVSGAAITMASTG
jgi:hypothetical protein